ncbi:GNAT family N-acetyltransferase [Macrococcoides caseolyticum]|uniref:GNAT family N-acetyltransferase n=1 Tax=Macrococcoides caseolyticum TaxID=69966 RepID=UPI001F16F7E8|nr:GNAT family N-acetyltransferase [Macrococcus caseolyticus]MCE4955972.1 GNAT family N-acetyltransferase [Macrococcus caseolyticus]
MWQYKILDELKPREIYNIFKLRVDTFVVEQQCYYEEIDAIDLTCMHLYKEENDQIIAYARIYTEIDYVKIGRVIVREDYRGKGLARELMQQALHYIDMHYHDLPIHLQGQAHLEDFYRQFNFETKSVVYFVDMIPHIDMVRRALSDKSI